MSNCWHSRITRIFLSLDTLTECSDSVELLVGTDSQNCWLETKSDHLPLEPSLYVTAHNNVLCNHKMLRTLLLSSYNWWWRKCVSLINIAAYNANVLMLCWGCWQQTTDAMCQECQDTDCSHRNNVNTTHITTPLTENNFMLLKYRYWLHYIDFCSCSTFI